MLSDLDNYHEYSFHNLKLRFRRIVIKWTMLAGLFLIFWFLKIFWLMFILLQLLNQEFWRFLTWLGEGTKAGSQSYWQQYGTYWLIAYLAISLLVVAEYFIHYRHKRPNLRRGGVVEGRVLWIRGIRRGLIYDLWDFYNYIHFKMNKKKGGDCWTRILKENMAVRNGTRTGILKWPDPLAIPLGRRNDSHYLIYYCRPFTLRWTRLEVPLYLQIQQSFFGISIPNQKMIARPDPLLFGRTIYQLKKHVWDYIKYDTKAPYSMQQRALEDARDLIQAAVAVNPETNILDFTEGSLPVVGLRGVDREDEENGG